ncbi:MAG: PEP-CTERM sorting domain-containing protein [Isosphaeraceae bacterium]
MRRLSLGLVLGIALGSSQARADLVIDFDDGISGNPIGSFYAALGVTFSNVRWFTNIDSTGNPAPGTSGPLVINGVNSTFYPKVDSPLVANFSVPVLNVSIIASGIGGNGARIDAYDALAGGNLVDFDQFIGTGAGQSVFRELAVSGSGIRRIELYQPLNTLGTGDGLSWDTLAYTAVPEPSSAILTLTGVVVGTCFGLLRKTRRPSMGSG